MRKINLKEIDKRIMTNRKEVNNQIIYDRKKRRKRSRVRCKSERHVLNQISVYRWKKALAKGDIKKLAKRKWYYDHRIT